MPNTIRPLTPDDATAYRTIRLEALGAHPEAFGASFEQEAAQNDAFFADRLAGSTVFGGFVAGELAGTAGFRRESGAKQAHKALLWGMYVRPFARRSGLSRRLVEAVLAYARVRVELIQLKVVATNVPARRLYESLGFEVYGIETRSLKLVGQYHDEVLMAKSPP